MIFQLLLCKEDNVMSDWIDYPCKILMLSAGRVLASIRAVIVGFFFYFCQFIISSRSLHSFWEEENYPGKSIQALRNNTIIISWLFSFRIILLTVQWHTFKTFIFVFIFSCSLQNLYNGSVQMYRKWFVFLQQSKISHFSFCNPHFSFSNLL